MATLSEVAQFRVSPLEVELWNRPGHWILQERNGRGFVCRRIESGRVETFPPDEQVASIRKGDAA